MRRTASSTRAIGTSPASTEAIKSANVSRQRSSTITMSTPAFTARAQASRGDSASCWQPFQSLITKPSKPSRAFSTSVSR